MLESVVQKHNFDPLLPKQVGAFYTVFVYRDLNPWKLFEVLQRFVSQVFVSACSFRHFEASGLPAVASTQGRHAVVVFQQFDEVFRVRCFPRASQVEVTHANYRLFELCASQ